MERGPAAAAHNLIIPLGGGTELRNVRYEDAEELFAVVDRNRARLREWLPWVIPEYSVDSARAFVKRSALEFAERLSLTMTIRHKGAVCGTIGLHLIERLHKSSSIGYWMDAAHEGEGIMSAACRAMVTEGFNSFGLHRIEIRCGTWNHRSSAIPRRLGFVEEGILREAEWVHDRWLDLRVFSMLAQDWPK